MLQTEHKFLHNKDSYVLIVKPGASNWMLWKLRKGTTTWRMLALQLLIDGLLVFNTYK